MPGLGLARGCGVWGEEHRGAAGLGGGGGRGGQSWVRAGAARGSSLPAGRGRPRGSVWSECAGRPAHLQRRAWKRAARPAVSPGRTLAAARPPESRLPGMTVGRQVVVASPPRFALQPALSHWGGAGGGDKGTFERIGSSVFLGIPLFSCSWRSPSLAKGPREVSPSLCCGLARPRQPRAQHAQG